MKFIYSLLQNSLLSSIGLLFIRVSVSGLMIFGHGLGKFNNVAAGHFDFSDPLGLGPMVSLLGASFAEFICPLFIVLGLYTRLAAIPIVFTMFVAGLVVHGADPLYPEFLGNLSPQHPNLLTPFKEYALLYALLFSAFIFTGPGSLSLDFLIGVEKKKR